MISACKVQQTRFSKRLNSTIENSGAFEHSFTGISVYDPTIKKVVFNYNSQKYFNSASNTKLFTFYAGLKILGDSIEGLKYRVSGDSIIIKGTGDPSFLNSELRPNNRIFNFLSDSSKRVFYVYSQYPQGRYGPGWAWDDYNDYYATEKAAFPIYGNTVKVVFKEELRKPEVYPEFFSKSFIKASNDEVKAGHASIQRDEFKNSFTYQFPKDTLPVSRIVPFLYSQDLFVKLLTDTLKKKVAVLPDYPSYLLTDFIYSIHADSLYKKMLHVSDNFIAEQLLLICANELSDTLQSEIAINFVKENYFNGINNKIQWADGSGLSRYNLFTPQSIVNILEKIYQLVPKERLFTLLPAGKQAMNLQKNLNTEEPFLFAKTGTLSNNFNLSGYMITKSGKTLIFSFMNNNYIIAGSTIKSEMENILTEIYENY